MTLNLLFLLTVGAARMSQLVVEVGGNRYTAGLVTQRSPTPSFAITLNTPSHAYLIKGNAFLFSKIRHLRN